MSYQPREPPISRIPFELLSQIFKECIPTDPTISNRAASLNLCCVCRDWRLVALSIPLFWSSMKVDVIRPQTMDFFIHWLELGGQCTLDIAIEYPDYYGSKRVLQRVVGAMLKHVLRLRVLRIVLPFRYTKLLLEGIHGPTNLQELHIGLDDSPEEILSIDLAHFPKLSHLKLLGVTDLDMVWDKQFSTRLSYASLGLHQRFDSCLELIKRSPLLQDLSVEFYCPLEMTYNGERVLAENLTRFSLRVNDENRNTLQFLDQVDLPSLNELIIDVSAYNPRRAQLQALGALMDYSKPPLQKFAYRNFGVSCDDLVAVLRLMPTLESLTLDSPVHGDFITAITYSSADPILPSLRTILFKEKVRAGLRHALDHFVTFAQSRNKHSGAALRTLKISKQRNSELVEALMNHPDTTLREVLAIRA